MTFEERLIRKPEDAERFRDLAQRVFGNEHGKALLSRLCAARHPLMHHDGMTEHEHGQAEVIATLWRFGATDPIPPQPQPPTT